jgi:8-oxo-dGTP pyrophosphatase MutT (NUDIX family)
MARLYSFPSSYPVITKFWFFLHGGFALHPTCLLPSFATCTYQRHDSLCWVNPDNLLEAAELAAEILRDVQARLLAWLRPVA